MISAGKCLCCLVVAFIANGISVSSSTELPAWDQANIEVKEGDDLSITCKVVGLGIIDVVRIVHKTSKQTATIADNDNVKLPYRGLPQYRIHYELDGDVGIIRLHYRGIRGIDSGSLGCYKLSDETNIAFIDIKVLVDVEKFYIVYFLEDGNEKRITDDASEIVSSDGDTVTVGCVATSNSGLIDPQMDIVIDDENRTADALLNKNLSSVMSDDDLVHYNSQIKLSLIFERVNRAHSRKIIKCTAKVKGYEDRSESTVLKVRYSPVITCSETTYKRQAGKSITFMCNIYSNPNVRIKWQKGNEEEEVVNATVKEKVLDEESVQVNLTIAELKASDFTNYTLTASNEIGMTTEIIIVEEYLESEDEVDLQATEEILGDQQSDPDFPIREDFDETNDESAKSDDEDIVKEAIHARDQSNSAVAGSSIVIQPAYVILALGFSTGAKWLYMLV